MVQSPSWEVNWFAASQEIPRISRNPKVHYRTHKRPPLVSILGQSNIVHITTSHLLEIRPNIIRPSTPRSPQWFLLSGFPTKTLYTSPIRATCPAHLILLDFITRTYSQVSLGKSSFQQAECSFHQQITLLKCYIWSLVSLWCWTLRYVDRKYLGNFEMCCWRRTAKISWTDRVRNVLQGVMGRGTSYVQKKEGRLTGLVTSCVGTAFWNTLLKER